MFRFVRVVFCLVSVIVTCSCVSMLKQGPELLRDAYCTLMSDCEEE